MRWLITVLFVSLLAITTGCLPERQEPRISPAPPKSTILAPERLSLAATQTQVSVLTPIVPPTSPPATPTLPPPEPSPELFVVGPFIQVSTSSALLAGSAFSLLPYPDGSFWLQSQRGFSQFKDDTWIGYLVDTFGDAIGMDRQGRFWSAARDGSQIAAWDGSTWQVYTSTLGWSPVASGMGLPVQPGLVQDALDRLWMLTRQDVRLFDGSSWKVFDLAALGFPAPGIPEIRTSFSIALQEPSQHAWVGICSWDGINPVGGGLRAYDEQNWVSYDSQGPQGCISQLHALRSGELWIGAANGLWHAQPDGSLAERTILPLPAGGSYSHFTRLIAGPDGTVWVILAAAEHQDVFHFSQGEWRLSGTLPGQVAPQLLPGKQNATWLFHAGQTYRIQGGYLESIHSPVVLIASEDESGQIWLIAEWDGSPGLWRLEETP